jgi:hypothetical protein
MGELWGGWGVWGKVVGKLGCFFLEVFGGCGGKLWGSWGVFFRGLW